MKLFQSASRFQSGAPARALRAGGRAASRLLTRAFPMPAYLYPHAAGVDISDASVKWLVLSQNGGIVSWGEEPLAVGIVKGGIIQDVAALAATLRLVKKRLGGISHAHAALPEEAAYVFSMHVPEGTKYEQALEMIEFEFEGRVPIPPAAAVYDFDIILRHDDGVGEEIGVAVFPLDLAQSYYDSFEAADMRLVSLELEARSIARAAVAASSDQPTTFLVDFGRERTGFAVVKYGVPIFTSTVEVGGDAITRALTQSLKLSEADAVTFRNEEGLAPKDPLQSAGVEAAAGTAAALSDEIARHYHYWDTRRNDRGDRLSPLGKIVLVGGSANLHGLPEYIAGRVQAPAEIADVWQHIVNYDTYIPPIDRRHSLQYATAAGLAMRSVDI